MVVIGITGGLGTGKTTVAGMFAGLGAKICDADSIAHASIRPGGACFKKVVSVFGEDILTRGAVDRRKLAQQVFNDRRKLKQLEDMIHPEVIAVMKRRIREYAARREKAVVLDVPLLFEAGVEVLADLVIVVKATPGEQVERTEKRLSLTREEILARMRKQMPLRQKISKADIVIDNTKTIQHTRKQVHGIWEAVLNIKKKDEKIKKEKSTLKSRKK